MSDIVMKQEPTPLEPPTPAAPDVEALLDKVRALFADKEQERGTPEAPTKAGFLALARSGKEVWNTWRKAYPEPMPDFSGVDFTELTAIDFSGFSFTGGVIKQGIISCVNFTGCKFGDEANFYGAQFGLGAGFKDAWFGDGACFKGTQFDGFARFEGARFGNRARFEGARFGELAKFDGAQFGEGAGFEGVQFGNWAGFDGVQFGVGAGFKGAQFGKGARFTAWDTLRTQKFWEVHKASDQQRVEYAKANGLRSDAFHSISFRGTQFHGYVDFQGRIFLSKTDFSLASFKNIPYFHGCALHQDTSFDDAEFLLHPVRNPPVRTAHSNWLLPSNMLYAKSNAFLSWK